MAQTVTLRCMIDSFEKIRKIFHMFHGVLIPRSTLNHFCDRVAAELDPWRGTAGPSRDPAAGSFGKLGKVAQERLLALPHHVHHRNLKPGLILLPALREVFPDAV